MHEPVHFSTDDAVLAQALYNAGVPEYVPPTNTFTPDFLRGLKRDWLRGLTVRAAGLAVWEHNKRQPDQAIRGKVEYHFEPVPELNALLEAYRDQQAEIVSEGRTIDIAVALRRLMRLAEGTEQGQPQMDEREALLRITCIALKGRIPFVNRWKDSVPRLALPAEGQSVTRGNTTSFPCGKNFPVNMSDEQLKDLGL